MEIQLNMLGVIVSDMPAALRFYRLLASTFPRRRTRSHSFCIGWAAV